MGAERRPRARGSSDRYLLRSIDVASEVIDAARLSSADHVVEIGAGDGALTRPLADVAGRVTAVELDPSLAQALRQAFSDRLSVSVVEGDFLTFPLPLDPWRAFGNVPFSVTTAILRRLLDDPRGALERADLIVQSEVARKRGSVGPGSLLTLGWQPWWDLTYTRRIPRQVFRPVPSVDAGVLIARRRAVSLLEAEHRKGYVSLLRRAFERGGVPIRRTLSSRLPPSLWNAIARRRGLSTDARPSELDVWDWVAVFRASGMSVRGRRRG